MGFNIPSIGFRLNWGGAESQPVDPQPVAPKHDDVPPAGVEGQATPDVGSVVVEGAPVLAADDSLPTQPAATPGIATHSPVDSILSQEAPRNASKSEDEPKKAEEPAEQTVSLPEQPSAAKSHGDKKEDAYEGDDESGEESSLPKPSADAFAQASPTIRSQLQQPEVVKTSLSSPVKPREEASQPQTSTPPPVPATAAHRDVPAVQEVLRAKVEGDVSFNPGLAGDLAELVSLLKGSIEEAQTAQIETQYKRLLDDLLPALSEEVQSVFVMQLVTLHQEIVRNLGSTDWVSDCRSAATVLLSSLEQLTHGAFEEISAILGTGTRPRTEGNVKDESVVTPAPTGWNRKHRHSKKN